MLNKQTLSEGDPSGPHAPERGKIKFDSKREGGGGAGSVSQVNEKAKSLGAEIAIFKEPQPGRLLIPVSAPRALLHLRLQQWGMVRQRWGLGGG